MAYQNNIPQPNDRLKNSQDDILQNFIEIQNLIDVNHFPFGDVNEGKHRFISLPQSAADPATAVSEFAFFSKLSALTGQTELFSRRPTNGNVNSITERLDGTSGWTRLPSGILLKWSEFVIPAQGAGVFNNSEFVNWPVNANTPVFSSIFQISGSVRIVTGSATLDSVFGIRPDTFGNPLTQIIIRTSSTNALGGYNEYTVSVLGIGT